MQERKIIHKVLGNRILVDVLPDNPREFSGIHLPDNFKMNNLMRGRVVDVGSKVNEELLPGDIVIFEGVYGKETDSVSNQRILDVGCLKAKLG